MITTNNFLREPIPDSVAHNAVSALFITNPSLMNWAKFMTQYSAPTAAAFVRATQNWGTTDRKDQTAFNVATDSTIPFFDFFAKTSELVNCFVSYMKSVQASRGTSLKHLLAGFDWADPGEALIVDVRLHQNTTLRLEVENSLTVRIGRRIHLHRQHRTSRGLLPSSDSSSRISRTPYPTAVTCSPHIPPARASPLEVMISSRRKPVRDADVYLLRMILHDWPSAAAIAILQNQLPALRADPNARLMIVDTVLPLPGSASPVDEALLRVHDLTMIQTVNSKERELGEFEELFSKANVSAGCLTLKNAVKPPGSAMSVMEVAYEPYRHEGTVSNGV